MLESVRRIVTGHDAAGRSTFLMNGPAPKIFEVGSGGTRVMELWETRTSPATNAGSEEATERPFRLPPPPNGSVFRIVEYPPDSKRVGVLAANAAHDDAAEGYVRDFANARHPGFHKTATTDYAIVIAGEIYALMDEGEQLMRAGDVLVQRGTNHSWSNRTDSNAYVAFILIDAIPAP